MSQPEYTCPGCGGHRFTISVETSAEVEFLPDEDHDVLSSDGDIFWADTNWAICANCTWTGKLGKAATP